MNGGIRGRLLAVAALAVVALGAVPYILFRTRIEALAGLPTGPREEVLAQLDQLAFWYLVVAVGLVFGLARLAASAASRTAQRLAAAARQLADGDIATVSTVVRDEELGELGAALEQLARAYSRILSDYRMESDRTRGILAGMREGVLLFDRKRRVALVNPALREMLLLGADIQGKSPLEVVRHPEIVRVLDEAERGEEAFGEIDLAGLKPRRLLVQAVRISGDEGGLLTVFVDVTHLRRLESVRKDFVANASHELRTPVASIYSAAETLELALSKDPAAAADFVQIIRRNSERLKNLVDDLLDLSRIESQDFRVYLEPIDLPELARSVQDLFAERAAKKSIRIEMALTEGASVRGDRRAIEHVLTNLVDNAVKYCGSGSTVGVRCERDGEAVRLIVEDDGPGIAEEHLSRIFERFYRVDPGRSRMLGGTGLGLSIVKHLVEAMDGRIEVHSESGNGTRFVVTLAAADLSAMSPRVTNPPGRPPTGPGTTSDRAP